MSSRGWHFLQVPGPTNVPHEVLAAMSRPTIDHRSEEFGELVRRVLGKLQEVIGTESPVVVYPSSGTGAWEASLVNTLSPGDHILMYETGYFATLWREMARLLGFKVHWLPGDWRHGADPEAIAAALAQDQRGEIKAVAIVHNETSTGVLSRVPDIRQAIDDTGHDALLLVDTISSLGSAEYRHDDWRVDVMVGCSQKGLMLPPGIGINAISGRALRAHNAATTPRCYWDWTPILQANQSGYFVYTPPTNLLFGLDVALDLLLEEEMKNVVSRHRRHAAVTRCAVTAWGLEIQCREPEEHSLSLTAMRMPDGIDADDVRRTVLSDFSTALGAGLGPLAGRVMRIGHLGSLNDTMLMGTLSAVECGLRRASVPIMGSGASAAIELLSDAGQHSERPSP